MVRVSPEPHSHALDDPSLALRITRLRPPALRLRPPTSAAASARPPPPAQPLRPHAPPDPPHRAIVGPALRLYSGSCRTGGRVGRPLRRRSATGRCRSPAKAARGSPAPPG